MSLVVAKKKGNHIYIVSETFLNNPDNLNKIELVAPAEYSLIKTLIINPFIAISFAGETGPLKEAIPVCRKLNYRIDEIVKYLLSVNISSGNKTEFIVCITLPPYVIYEIKNSAVNDRSESAWRFCKTNIL